jgi:hypothetical protein
MEEKMSGSCQCGQVTYTITALPKAVFACHCKECQKLSTAPYSITALFATQDIEFRGELKEWSRGSDSGNINSAKFCPDCGNRVYHFNPDDTSTVKLKLRPVDAKYGHIFEPSAHVWVSEKLDWVEIPSAVKVFEKGVT